MTQVVTNGTGIMFVNSVDTLSGAEKGKTVRISSGNEPCDLTRWEAFEFVRLVLDKAGILHAEGDEGLTIVPPESPRWTQRRYTLSVDYFAVGYESLKPFEQKIIDHIMTLEKKLEKAEQK